MCSSACSAEFDVLWCLVDADLTSGHLIDIVRGKTTSKDLVVAPDLRWDSLSTVTKTGKQRMRLRHALLKLAYFGPNDRIATPGDCRKLLSGKDMQSKVDQCEAILSELHEITKKHTRSKEKCIQLLGMAECKVVATLLQKKHRGIPWPWSFDSMEEAAYEFIELFSKEVGETNKQLGRRTNTQNCRKDSDRYTSFR